MNRLAVVSCLLLVVFCSRLSAADVIDDAQVLDMFADVLERGLSGPPDAETAAFIIRDGDGSDRCLLWPSTGDYHAAHYNAVAPAGIVAIVHTHPSALPIVSPDDRSTAVRLGIPVYAITARTIYMADPFGKVIAVISSGRWSRTHEARGVCTVINRQNGEKSRFTSSGSR